VSVFLVEMAVGIDAAGTQAAFRFATDGYTGNNKSWPGAIVDAISIRREARGAPGGSGRVIFSDLVLANADGWLDEFADYAFDGRQIIGYTVPSTSSDFSERQTIFDAAMGPISFDDLEIRIPIIDRMAMLEQDIVTATYAGDNVLPNGLEGTASDIGGKVKPFVFGLVRNASPPFVNTSRLIWQFSASEDADVTAVYEGGIALTRGADYADEADMMANAPSAGEYRVWPRASQDGGYFRLGSTPAHAITADIDAGGADQTPARALDVLASRVPRIATDIATADVTALSTALPEPVGFWRTEPLQTVTAMTRIASGCNIWFGFDALGELRMGEWGAPVGSPVATFIIAGPDAPLDATTYDLGAFSVEPSRREDIPTWKVTVLHDRNHTVQQGLATAITSDRRAEVEQEWRREVDEDAAALTMHINAQTVEIESAYATAAGASTAASDILAARKVRRFRLRIETEDERGLLQTVYIGSEVELKISRFGFDAGRGFRVRAIETEAASSRVKLELWG